MTPQEKAIELVDKMYHYQWREKQRAKECALIAVNEILSIKPNNPFIVNGYYIEPKKYWKEVESEIEKL